MRDEHGGLAEVRVGARGLHQGSDLSLADDRSGVHRITRRAGRGQRLAGECGLVDLDLIAVQQPGIGRDDVDQAQPDDVAGHQLSGSDHRLLA